MRAAYAAGELSYSKVRALARVGAIAREEELLGLARHATAAQLERMVRGYRRVAAAERAADGRPERYVTWQHDDDGSVLLYARLPAEEGATVLAALEAGMDDSAEAVGRDSAEAFGSDSGSGYSDSTKHRRARSGALRRSSRSRSPISRVRALPVRMTSSRSSCMWMRRRSSIRVGRSSATGPRSRLRPRGAWRAMRRSLRWWSATAGRSRWVARRARSRRPCGARWNLATVAAGSPAVRAGGACMRTTSSTGRTAGRPSSRISSSCARFITGSSMGRVRAGARRDRVALPPPRRAPDPDGPARDSRLRTRPARRQRRPPRPPRCLRAALDGRTDGPSPGGRRPARLRPTSRPAGTLSGGQVSGPEPA